MPAITDNNYFEMESKIQRIAFYVETLLKKVFYIDIKFILLIFRKDDPLTINDVSNDSKENVIKALKTTIERLEKGE